MKYMKRTGIYKSRNVTFDPKTKDAYSYSWWRFVGVVEGVLLFNNYRYSVTTSKHQRKVQNLMTELGIKADVVLPLIRGIRHDQTLAELYIEAEEFLCDEFIADEYKKIIRNEKARERRALKRAKLDAEFKSNVESITIEDIQTLKLINGGAR